MYVDYNTPSETVSNKYALNNSISNILATKRGSLQGKPRFGSDLYRVIFNQLDHVTVNLIKQIITDALDEFEPRVSINSINIKNIPEFNKIIAIIDYNYIDNGMPLTNTVKLNLSQ
jgi:phage baseplate assembly protein W